VKLDEADGPVKEVYRLLHENIHQPIRLFQWVQVAESQDLLTAVPR